MLVQKSTRKLLTSEFMTQVETYDVSQNLWLVSELMTWIRTYERHAMPTWPCNHLAWCWNLWLRSELTTRVRTYDVSYNLWLGLELMMWVRTYDPCAMPARPHNHLAWCWNSWHTLELIVHMLAQYFTSEVLTYVITSDDRIQRTACTTVETFDSCHNFRHHKSPKNFFVLVKC